MAKLFTKENEVIDGITQEQFDQVAKLVAQVQDKDTKARFESILHKVEEKLMATLLAAQDVDLDNVEIKEEQAREERDIEKEVNIDKTQETQRSSRPSMQTSKPQKASYQSSRPASKPSQSKLAKKKPSAKPYTDKQKPTKPSGSSSSDKVGNSNKSDATENNNNNEEHVATNPSQPPTAPSEEEASSSTNQAGE